MHLIKSSIILATLYCCSLVFAQDKLFTNQQIWASRDFSPEYVSSVASMNDGEHFSVLEGNKIVKYSYTDFSKAVAVILDGDKLSGITIEDYSFNADESKVLIATKVNYIYRRSFTAEYFVVDIKSSKVTKLYENGAQMLADFSPDGSKVAFVFENNLYIRDLNSEKITQLTTDGKQNSIINGSTDWVYEEEFEITKAFYWSPDGARIAYLRFDESAVKEFTMDYYQGGTYPEPYTFKYPKAGEDNSKLELKIYSLTDGTTRSVNYGGYEYIPRMKWSNDANQLVYLTMNRHQNELNYMIADCAGSGDITGHTIYTDKSETYVEVDNNLVFLENKNAFIRTSEKDGYKHIYLIEMSEPAKEFQITKGSWDVIELKGINEKAGLIYYTSAEEGAMYQSLYSIKLDGTGKVKLSAELGHNESEFSNGMKYYINTWSNINTPYKFSVHTANGKLVTTLKDNASLKSKLKEFKISPAKFISIKGADELLNAFIILPTDFDSTKKYPVYFNIYNGPGHNTVIDQWGGSNYYYHQQLAQKGYIVISVDTRGTMYRGAEFKKCTYLQLGKLETEDMIAVAREVGQWSYVDASRIGVMGWSYGGYMSSLCITKGADVFKMAIAVAPVTNWRWYDNIYTERFMRTPAENASGYDDNSPINHVEKLTGKYLLIHGSGDDNVHVQNTMEMVDALVKKNKDFDMFIYTNKNHGIYGGYTRLHLYNKMLEFTLENL
ncbi:MAG: S9 family peptidase [Crocinitomicaceae bacterium]|nr:S9 family peptidase [Crocinitomicaceae bacterium]MBK8925769.1 S9 family peptidase [Crocinitomicaceae bacterium]